MIVLLDLRGGDDIEIASSLKDADLDVEHADDFAVIETRGSADDCDVLIVGRTISGVTGLAIVALLRKRAVGAGLPIFLLSDDNQEQSRVQAFQAGVDDFVASPISLPETVARIRALLRRKRSEFEGYALVHGDIQLDRARKRVRRGGRLLHLGPLEYEILLLLMKSPGKVFTRARLAELVWPQGMQVRNATINTSIARLRASLSTKLERDPIRTMRGEGYYMDQR